MGYTHYSKIVGEEGVYVGANGAEIAIADSTGKLAQQGIAIDASAAEIDTALEGCTATAAELNKSAGIPATAYQMVCEKRTFTETAEAGTYTAEVDIPAGAIVQDVIVASSAVWAAATSATLDVGDADDPNGFFAAVDLKTAPAADTNGAGGVSSLLSGAGSGAYKGIFKRYAAAGKITAAVVTVGETGDTGRTEVYVIYSVPTAVAATKVDTA